MKKIKHRLQKVVPRRRKNTQSLAEAAAGVARVTNETVAEHREEVLGSARKYIYPLQHSRHRIVIISVSILIAVVLAFFTYTLLALYRFHATSTFMYRVTQVIPFPIARAGSSLVSYENYLFELRRYMHYYETQQEVDFSSEDGQAQLADFRKRALESVIDAAFVKKMAAEHDLSVSGQEIDAQIELLRSQNRLGGNDEVFEDVLKEFWGWSTDDFRRELRQQLLAQKVVSKLDAETHERANNVLKELKNGGKFAELAKKHSDDISTKGNGGDYGFSIERTNRDIQPQIIDELFKLKEGQTSAIIETATGLEIVKVTEVDGSRIRAAHVAFNFKPIAAAVDPLKQEQTVWRFIST